MSFANFFQGLLQRILGDIVRLFVAFGMGTGIGAGVCLYYGFPIGFSLVGGLIVLGVVAALLSEV